MWPSEIIVTFKKLENYQYTLVHKYINEYSV